MSAFHQWPDFESIVRATAARQRLPVSSWLTSQYVKTAGVSLGGRAPFLSLMLELHSDGRLYLGVTIGDDLQETWFNAALVDRSKLASIVGNFADLDPPFKMYARYGYSKF